MLGVERITTQRHLQDDLDGWRRRNVPLLPRKELYSGTYMKDGNERYGLGGDIVLNRLPPPPASARRTSY